jgi:hypothetical protein
MLWSIYPAADRISAEPFLGGRPQKRAQRFCPLLGRINPGRFIRFKQDRGHTGMQLVHKSVCRRGKQGTR